MSHLKNVAQYVCRSSNQQNLKVMCRATSKKWFTARHYRCASQAIQSHKFSKSNNCLARPNSMKLFQNNYPQNYYSTEAGDGEKTDISTRISGLVAKSDIVVFMKGVPSAPRCGFSNAVCQIFRMHNVEVDAHDVLEDEELRQGIKEFSNWPTIPQVYFKGEFIGGCDILLQMHQSGELVEELDKIGIKSALVAEDEKK